MYQALPSCLQVKHSSVAGQGIFATEDIPDTIYLGISHIVVDGNIMRTPLGGFVKISGIIDESMDTSHINKDPEPWEFRSKPAWQRLIVMLGGIIFNVITGLILFTIITYNNGETFLSKEEINKNGVLALELGLEAGFETGDKILLINGKDWERDAELFDPNLFFEDNTTFTVLRQNQEVSINIPDNFINRMNSREAMSSFLKARTPFIIDSVYANAQKAGLVKGDKIVKVDEKSIVSSESIF